MIGLVLEIDIELTFYFRERTDNVRIFGSGYIDRYLDRTFVFCRALCVTES